MLAVRRIERVISVRDVRRNPRNARVHSNKQIGQIADSIKAFGFVVPIVVDESLVLIAGEGRLEAAKRLGLLEIPAIELRGLSDARKRALALADNKICDNAGWDRERLVLEVPELAELLIEEGLDIGLTGFSSAELDQLHIDFEENSSALDDKLNPSWKRGAWVSERGSLWLLGPHRLLCGDARDDRDLTRLMGSERAAMSFADMAYNLAVRSIGGRGRTTPSELSTPEYVDVLVASLGNCCRSSQDGAIHFVCCDWRQVANIIEAGRLIYGAMLNIVVWVKSKAGQGSFYRSRHELIVVFQVGKTVHDNNVELGRHSPSRSNVWNYGAVNAFPGDRTEKEERSYATAKPVSLIADAMRDCTRLGDVVLDAFSGSGTTIMAAERIGRRAYAMDIDPRYVDVAIRRWQAFTRRDAVHAETGATFDQLTTERPIVPGEPQSHSAPQRKSRSKRRTKESCGEKVSPSCSHEQLTHGSPTKRVGIPRGPKLG